MKSKNKLILFSIIISLVIGMGVSFSPLCFFILLLTLISGVIIWSTTSGPERKFLLSLFVFAISIRFFLCIVYYLSALSLGNDVGFFGDARGYTLNGLYIAELLSNHKIYYFLHPKTFLFLRTAAKDFSFAIPPLSAYQFNGLVYLNSILFSLFGYSALATKFLNSLLFVISGIFFYFISKKLFSQKVAKLASMFILFYPSMIFWSITALKDAAVIFLISIITWLILKFHENHKLFYLGIMIIASIALYTIRAFILLPLLVIAFCLFICSKTRLLKKLTICFLILVTISLAFHFLEYDSSKGKDIPKKLLFQSIIRQRSNFMYGGSIYKIYDSRFYHRDRVPELKDINVVTPMSFLISFIKGWTYFMFSPFPWSISTKMQLAVFPQVIFMYILTPFTILGMLLGFRYRFGQAFGILSFMFITISILCLVEANVGTVFRHRDMIMPFYLIFSAAGIIKLFNVKQSIFGN